MSLTRDIKDFGLDLGYSAVGVTTAEPFPQFIQEMTSRRDAYSWVIDG
ncbi:MAG: epoxyqueuosine reductase, partial [Dehalococcoidia bacterium]|nr:epoxyqueuosine reductase [Dehalococcoidia bacterium]